MSLATQKQPDASNYHHHNLALIKIANLSQYQITGVTFIDVTGSMNKRHINLTSFFLKKRKELESPCHGHEIKLANPTSRQVGRWLGGEIVMIITIKGVKG